MLFSEFDKAKLFAENFSKNFNLDDSVISLPVFPSRTNLKLYNISVTTKMVKKVITNLTFSKASGPDCIAVVVLKNWEPEPSYILAEVFNKFLKESCFPDCWKVSLVVPVFKIVGERSTVKNYGPVSLLSVVSKVFGMLVFFINVSLTEFQVKYLALFLLFPVIDSFEWFWMASLHKNNQLMLEFLKAPVMVLHSSYYTLMTFLMIVSVILVSIYMILLSVLSVIRHLICDEN